MNPVLAGEICGGQSAAVKRRQKFRAPGGIGARRATTWKNTVSFHGRVFTTPRRRSIGGRPFTAYKRAQKAQNWLTITEVPLAEGFIINFND
jgi:hypothetical protein